MKAPSGIVRTLTIAGLIAFATVLAPSGAAAADKLNVGKADSTDYDFTLLQVGIDAGIFKKYNLEIKTVTLPGAQLDEKTARKAYDELMPMFIDDGHFDPKGFAVVKQAMIASGVANVPDNSALYTEEYLPK
jgi:hypothetical protein